MTPSASTAGSTREEQRMVYRIHILASSRGTSLKKSMSGSNNSERSSYSLSLSSVIPPMLAYIGVTIMVTITTYFF